MNNIFDTLKQVTDFEALPTKVLGAGVTEDIIITRKAMDGLTKMYLQIQEQTSNSKAANAESLQLRLYMRSTADKSKQYCMAFDNQITEFDNVYQIGKINIVIDRKNIFYFMGIIIDYVENENEKGFVFLDTDDQKVGDYYAMLADEQALTDYNENIGNNDMLQNTETLGQTTSTLYQDELYDIKEVTEENNLEPILQDADMAEGSTAQNNSQLNTETNELEQMQNTETAHLEDSAELSASSNITQDAAGSSANNIEEQQSSNLKQSQKVEAHEEQAALPDRTSVVQKRAITGIHFQD